jgi:hypothetical protein
MFAIPSTSPMGGSVIKSIQRGTVASPASSGADITISKVNPAKTLVISNSSAVQVGGLSSVYLKDEVTINYSNGGSSGILLVWQVVEYA